MQIVVGASNVDEVIGQYHSMFLYFPIVFFTAALVADILNYFGRSQFFTAGHWFIIIGVLFCIPTLFTGIAAEAGYEPGNYFLERHRYLGITTAISGSFYAGLRISTMLWNLPLRPIHFVILSALLVALVSWVSDYGFLIPYWVP